MASEGISQEVLKNEYINRFEEWRSLGSGSFSTVFEAKSLKDGKHYAIKKIPFASVDYDKTLKEIKILHCLESDFVARIIDSWVESNYYIPFVLHNNIDPRSLLCDSEKPLLLHIQLELCAITLKDYIKLSNYTEKNKLTPDQFSIACLILTQLLECVQYLHSQNPPILHRDLKPANVMLTNSVNGKCVKLTDFGLSTFHEFVEQSLTKYIGTPRYRAPEVDSNSRYNTKADVYSLGRIMEDLFNIDHNISIVDGTQEEFKIIKKINLKCLQTIVTKRPSCDDLIKQSYSWSINTNISENLYEFIEKTNLMQKVLINSMQNFESCQKHRCLDIKIDDTCRTTQTFKRTHNILLLGETGVGKSTLINAMANYMKFDSFQSAKKGPLLTLIGTSFEEFNGEDKNAEIKTIFACDDENETENDFGESSTHLCRTYKFNLGNGVYVRFIDTPGVDKDLINFENTMKVIDSCGEISAFCIVMKSDQTRVKAHFRESLNQLFAQLHHSISQNVVFIFTRGKCVDYYARNAVAFIKHLLKTDRIPIEVNKSNSFCFENDNFNFLVIQKQQMSSTIMDSDISWKYASELCKVFFNYVLNLKPHNLRNTININYTRQLLDKLTVALLEITNIIDFNLNQIDERTTKVQQTQTVAQLQKLIYKPDVLFETVKLDKPNLVCTGKSCTTYYQENYITMRAIFDKICCDDCGHLKHIVSHGNHVEFKSRGLPNLFYCSKCNCPQKYHKIIYVKTVAVSNEHTAEDGERSLIKNLKTDNTESVLKRELVLKLNFMRKTFFMEWQDINKALALFSRYITHNSIIKDEDIFKQYVSEKIRHLKENNINHSDGFKNMLYAYEKEEEELKNASKSVVTHKELYFMKQYLCGMTYNGKSIEKIYRTLENYFDGQEIEDEICIDVSSTQ